MRVLSLFSGIGGIDLGLERAGFTIAYHAEIEPYPAAVLRKHWPDVPNLGDVTKIKWEELDHVDVIAGGYPCQPFSTAGKRKGEEDPRHLWPYFRDAIRVLRPRYALMENVRGHLSLGFGTVLADLASLGYCAEWQVVPASSVGAPHRRDRVFIVAYPEVIGGDGRGSRSGTGSAYGGQAVQEQTRGSSRAMAYADDARKRASERGVEREASPRQSRRHDVFCESGRSSANVEWREWWKVEPDVGRVAHGIPARVDRLRALGNGVVPQVAEWVGRRIMAHANATL